MFFLLENKSCKHFILVLISNRIHIWKLGYHRKTYADIKYKLNFFS